MNDGLKDFIFKILFSLSLIASLPAYSSPWEIETEVFPGDIYEIKARITSWDTGNMTSNPLYHCRGGNACELYILYYDVYGVRYPSEAIWIDEQAREKKTLGELGEYLIQRGLFNRTITGKTAGGGGEICFFLGYRNSGGGALFLHLPGGPNVCQHQITPTYCDFYLPNIELRHGVLSPDKTNGNTAKATLNAQCSSDLQVRIVSADNSDSIFFNGVNGFRSDLQVDGVNIGRGKVVTVTPTGVLLSLTSTLAGYDGSTGTFQGSKTIIIALP
ncbi:MULTISPECIES: MrpH family fimbial adhesin [Serratia]|uniref:Fimbrial adhesin MrpH C-terminal domain-containing protein n=2 Tax=Serratia TaxID=613 RepID=A0A1G5EFF1_9GAMM|nr:hypothetical protein [Serratia nematodiphila]UTO01796.1 hypothetical protein NLX84_01455 [Serratia nematodiphila]SCY25709.1 hypothetical protein SAMN02927935_01158 [Serratia nematodiphila]